MCPKPGALSSCCLIAGSLQKGVRGTGSADPQRMLIFWVLLIFRIINVGLIFIVTRKRLTYHVAIKGSEGQVPLARNKC